MAVLHEAGIDNKIMVLLEDFFWKWYDANTELVIFRTKIAKLFTVTIRVKQLKPLFERLFGPQPSKLFQL